MRIWKNAHHALFAVLAVFLMRARLCFIRPTVARSQIHEGYQHLADETFSRRFPSPRPEVSRIVRAENRIQGAEGAGKSGREALLRRVVALAILGATNENNRHRKFNE